MCKRIFILDECRQSFGEVLRRHHGPHCVVRHLLERLVVFVGGGEDDFATLPHGHRRRGGDLFRERHRLGRGDGIINGGSEQ